MTKLPPRKKKGVGTHYSYKGGGDAMRKVVKIFNLSKTSILRRRELVNQLIEREGEYLACLPPGFEVDCNLDDLERFLEGDL